jgi:hypothetical protein
MLPLGDPHAAARWQVSKAACTVAGMRRGITLVGLAVLIGVAIVPGDVAGVSAAAAARSCGTESHVSGGSVFRVKAQRATCRVAKQVAGGWYNVQSQGDPADQIYDRKGRRWSCRITEHATGTDPGYNPFTRVRCARQASVVRFLLRS